MQDITDKITELQEIISIPEVKYIVAGSIFLAATAVVSYYLHRRKRPENKLYNSLLDESTAQEN